VFQSNWTTHWHDMSDLKVGIPTTKVENTVDYGPFCFFEPEMTQFDMGNRMVHDSE
jgi:hypothetical protein